jgi:hypothetical protein
MLHSYTLDFPALLFVPRLGSYTGLSSYFFFNQANLHMSFPTVRNLPAKYPI